MAKQIESRGRRWYAIHTYSGMKKQWNVGYGSVSSLWHWKIKFLIFWCLPKKIKIKNGKRRVVTEKIFPGYVFVDMSVTDDSWYA